MAVVNLPTESWRAIGRRLAQHPRPVIWSWVAIRGQEAWQLAGVSIRGDVDREPCRLDYGRVRIGVERLDGAAAARRWRRGVAAGRGAPARFALESIASPVPVQLLTSGGSRPLLGGLSDWPVVCVSTGLPGVTSSSLGLLLQDSLHRPGSPFYPTLAAALGELVYDANPVELLRLSAPHLLVRLDVRRARIETVTAAEGKIKVNVDLGEDVGGDLLLRSAWRATSAATNWERRDVELSTPDSIELEPERIPAEFVAAIVDHNGHVLDRHGWSEGFGPSLDQLASLEARVARLLALGEGEQVEYKRQLGDRKVNLSFVETMTAFANGTGGIILIGINDDASVIGCADEKCDDRVQNIVRDCVSGPVTFEVATASIDGRPVQVVTVQPAGDADKPLTCKDRVMVRAGATTRVAERWEIRRLAHLPAT